MARAAEVLRTARRPFVIAGGGVRHSAAEDELRRFVDTLGIPVAETSAGKGSLSGCEWLVGGMGVNGTRVANELAATADVVVCVGTRLTDFTTGSHSAFQHPDVRFIGINVNGADAAKLSSAPIVADAREALRSLAAALDGPLPDREARRSQVTASWSTWRADLAADIAPVTGRALGQGEVLAALNDEVARGDWVVAAAGWQPGDLLKLWDTPAGSFTHIEFGASCMGHEIPAAIGIRMHVGDGPEVIAVIGDGTYLMNPSELFTAVQEGSRSPSSSSTTAATSRSTGSPSATPAVPSATSSARRGGSGRFPDGERIGVDFVANAASLGCRATLATDVASLRAASDGRRAPARSASSSCPPTPTGRCCRAAASGTSACPWRRPSPRWRRWRRRTWSGPSSNGPTCDHRRRAVRGSVRARRGPALGRRPRPAALRRHRRRGRPRPRPRDRRRPTGAGAAAGQLRRPDR